jgi:endonuclease/exonuclease/phosphatase (EEP) superfamily protein YafD
VKRLAGLLLLLVLLPCAAGAVAAVTVGFVDLGGVAGWLLDLAVHWQWLYAAAGLASAVVVGWCDRRLAWLAAACAAVVVAGFLQFAPRLPDNSKGGATLRVVSANVYLGNRDLTRLFDWIGEVDPDLVFLQEVTAATAPSLQRLERYPHVLIDETAKPFAVAVLSKHALERTTAVHRGGTELGGQRLSFRTEMRWQGRTIAIAAVHAAAPEAPRFRQMRDELLADTTNWVHERQLPAIVAGDLNTTPWSRALRQSAARGLRRATRLAPTWPVWPLLPSPVPLIPIDHVLATAHWSVRDSARGPRFGSDHRPVFVSLSLEPAGSSARQAAAP